MMQMMTPATNRETDRALTRLSQILDKSLAKSLSDIVASSDDILEEGDVKRANRFIYRLAQIGHLHVSTRLLRCKKAELAHQLRAEEDFTLFRHPETNERYRRWLDFRPILANALTIAPSTLSDHISLVRYAKEVLLFEEGDFTRYNGLTTVRHMRDMCTGVDGRSSKNFALTVRPKSTKFADRLKSDFHSDDGWPGMLRRYYFEEQIFHDLTNPEALNRPAGDLGDKAREELGAPKIRARHAMVGPMIAGYIITATYPDDDEGLTVEEDFELKFMDEFVPPGVRDQIDRRLGIRRD